MTKLMKLQLLLIIWIGLMFLPLNATLIVYENIQDWSAHTSYGSYTQEIDTGLVQMTRCLVAPGAQANGVCSAGRIQMEASTGTIELPLLNSIGDVEFTFAAGSAGRSVNLQKFSGGAWTLVSTFTGINQIGTRHYARIGENVPTRLRLINSSHAIYLHDILVTDYVFDPLPVLATPVLSAVTYNTANLLAGVESSGSTAITNRGFCWDTQPLAEITDNQLPFGTGISPILGTITGLNPNTTYYVRAFAQNSNGIGYSPEITITTSDIGIPEVQATNITYYPGSTSIYLSWNPGSGSRRLVKINTINNFTDPINGVEYDASAIYLGGGEQVVYCGATQVIEEDIINSVSVSGLNRNTQYWFRVYELNGQGANTIYNTTMAMGNPSSITTLNTSLVGYYDAITGLGLDLKANLHSLLRDSHLTQFSYDALWQQLQYTDEDSLNTNNIIQTYTGWSIPKSFYGTGSTQWNREHTWSVSHGSFSTTRPAGTDLHHIRPCDVTVNSAKGNKDFDLGGNPYVDSSPYPGYDGNTGCNTATNFWEPRDADKGDVARMLFYMAVRYEGTDTGLNLELMDTTPTTAQYYGKLSTLLAWHFADPPDAKERRRNDRIQERQGNRNPFIDRPEYVSGVWTPRALSASIVSDDYFVAHWSHTANAISYYVDVSTDSLFSTFIYENVDAGYNDMYGLNTGGEDIVYFRVRTFFGEGYSQYSNVLQVNTNIPSVVLNSFTATISGEDSVLLQWVTENEMSMMGYYVFRSEDATLNNAILVSETLIGANNTVSISEYSFDDIDIPVPNTGAEYFYWLSAINLYGETEYFGPVSVEFLPSATIDDTHNPTAISISAYPNPFSDILWLDLDLPKQQAATIGLYNIRGQKLQQWHLDGAGKIPVVFTEIDKGNSSSGLYFIRLTSGQHSSMIKVIRTK